MSVKDIEDIYDLKRAYREKHPDGHFFDDETLRFFGERLSEMHVLKGTVKITDILGKEHECYVLSCYQRPPFGQKKRVHHYFDVEDIDEVFRD